MDCKKSANCDSFQWDGTKCVLFNNLQSGIFNDLQPYGTADEYYVDIWPWEYEKELVSNKVKCLQFFFVKGLNLKLSSEFDYYNVWG